MVIIDNTTDIVDQPRLPRFKAYTNYDNYVGVGTWTKIAINNTDTNDQGAFDAANNHFVAPVDGTYLFGASLRYKVNASMSARMSGRLVLNGTTEIRGSFGEISGAHVSEATALWLQTMAVLTAGKTVQLLGSFRAAGAQGEGRPNADQVTVQAEPLPGRSPSLGRRIRAGIVRYVRAITFHRAEVAVTGSMVRAIIAAIHRLRAPPSCA